MLTWPCSRLPSLVVALMVAMVAIHLSGHLWHFSATDAQTCGSDQSSGTASHMTGGGAAWRKPSADEDGGDLFGAAGEAIINEMKAENIEKYLRYLTSQGHMAGTKQDLEQAEYLRKLWLEQGIDQVFLQPYNVQLSHPVRDKPNKVYLLDEKDQIKFRSQMFEESLNGQPYDESIPAAFLAFSPAATITANELVYVNFGTYEDFEMVESLGISVKDRLVLTRFGAGFRGDKVLNAQRFGAAGVIMYTDPSEYNPEHETGPSYPNSLWLPGSGIQRGSIVIHDGDPTTPFYPAIAGAYRVPDNQTDTPKIPAHTLSYNDARKLIANMGGPEVPPEWRGLLNVTYRLGPMLARKGWSVRLEVNNVRKVLPTYNVIGVVRGSEEPDRYVIVGNHRDSWVFGSMDPSSATAVQMEMVRAFGQLVRKGWRPRRSIVIGSWGAGEYGFFGTTEWVEEYLKVLESRAVAHLNLDLAIIYTYNILISATPLLHKVIREATKWVPAPDPSLGFDTLWDHWTGRVRAASPDLIDYNLGSISEHAPFYQRVGIPTSYMVWEINYEEMSWNDYPLYHSTYEDFDLMKNLLDPDFSYHLSVGRLWALMALGLVDARVLPMDPEDEAIMHSTLLQELRQEFGSDLTNNGVSLVHLENVIDKFAEVAKDFNQRVANSSHFSDLQARQFSDQLMQLEKCYTDAQGIKQRPHFKNTVFGTDDHNQYHGVLAPGVRDALWSARRCVSECQSHWEEVRQQLSVLVYVINSATLMLRDHTKL